MIPSFLEEFGFLMGWFGVCLLPAVGPLLCPQWARSSARCGPALLPAVGPLFCPQWAPLF